MVKILFLVIIDQKAEHVLCEEMSYIGSLISYWSILNVQDFLSLLFLVSILAITVVINHVFKCFIDSKPAGRKTVLGKRS